MDFISGRLSKESPRIRIPVPASILAHVLDGEVVVASELVGSVEAEPIAGFDPTGQIWEILRLL